MNRLEGRGALVTGGGRGIGAAVAEALAAEGAAVVVTARSADEIEAVAGGLRARGRVAHAVVCDVARRGLAANPASLSRAIRDGAATFEEAGVGEAYCGDPAAATAREGEETVATLAAIVVEAVAEGLGEAEDAS